MSCIYLHLMDVGAADPLARKMGGREGRLLASSVVLSVGLSVGGAAGGHEGQMEQNSLGNSVYLITASLPPSLPRW